MVSRKSLNHYIIKKNSVCVFICIFIYMCVYVYIHAHVYVHIRQHDNTSIWKRFTSPSEWVKYNFYFFFFFAGSCPKGLRLIALYNSWWQKDLQFLIISPSIGINILRYYLKDCAHFKINWSRAEPLVSSCKATICSDIAFHCFGQPS